MATKLVSDGTSASLITLAILLINTGALMAASLVVVTQVLGVVLIVAGLVMLLARERIKPFLKQYKVTEKDVYDFLVSHKDTLEEYMKKIEAAVPPPKEE